MRVLLIGLAALGALLPPGCGGAGSSDGGVADLAVIQGCPGNAATVCSAYAPGQLCTDELLQVSCVCQTVWMCRSTALRELSAAGTDAGHA